jgi:hypothetical protein
MKNRNEPECLRVDILEHNINVTQLIFPHNSAVFCVCSVKQRSYGRMACSRETKALQKSADRLVSSDQR